jgi:hypothetical protein
MDFQHGLDKIDLSLTHIDESWQGFRFVEASNSARTAGDLVYDAATGVLSGYVDDDDTADFQIILANRPVLSAADFVL